MMCTLQTPNSPGPTVRELAKRFDSGEFHDLSEKLKRRPMGKSATIGRQSRVITKFSPPSATQNAQHSTQTDNGEHCVGEIDQQNTPCAKWRHVSSAPSVNIGISRRRSSARRHQKSSRCSKSCTPTLYRKANPTTTLHTPTIMYRSANAQLTSTPNRNSSSKKLRTSRGQQHSNALPDFFASPIALVDHHNISNNTANYPAVTNGKIGPSEIDHNTAIISSNSPLTAECANATKPKTPPKPAHLLTNGIITKSNICAGNERRNPPPSTKPKIAKKFATLRPNFRPPVAPRYKANDDQLLPSASAATDNSGGEKMSEVLLMRERENEYASYDCSFLQCSENGTNLRIVNDASPRKNRNQFSTGTHEQSSSGSDTYESVNDGRSTNTANETNAGNNVDDTRTTTSDKQHNPPPVPPPRHNKPRTANIIKSAEQKCVSQTNNCDDIGSRPKAPTQPPPKPPETEKSADMGSLPNQSHFKKYSRNNGRNNGRIFAHSKSMECLTGVREKQDGDDNDDCDNDISTSGEYEDIEHYAGKDKMLKKTTEPNAISGVLYAKKNERSQRSQTPDSVKFRKARSGEPQSVYAEMMDDDDNNGVPAGPQSQQGRKFTNSFMNIDRKKMMSKLPKKLRPQSTLDVDKLLRIKSDIQVNITKKVGQIKFRVSSHSGSHQASTSQQQPVRAAAGEKTKTRQTKTKSLFFVPPGIKTLPRAPTGPNGEMIASIAFPLENTSEDNIYGDDWSSEFSSEEEFDVIEENDHGSEGALPDLIPTNSVGLCGGSVNDKQIEVTPPRNSAEGHDTQASFGSAGEECWALASESPPMVDEDKDRPNKPNQDKDPIAQKHATMPSASADLLCKSFGAALSLNSNSQALNDLPPKSDSLDELNHSINLNRPNDISSSFIPDDDEKPPPIPSHSSAELKEASMASSYSTSSDYSSPTHPEADSGNMGLEEEDTLSDLPVVGIKSGRLDSRDLLSPEEEEEAASRYHYTSRLSATQPLYQIYMMQSAQKGSTQTLAGAYKRPFVGPPSAEPAEKAMIGRQPSNASSSDDSGRGADSSSASASTTNITSCNTVRNRDRFVAASDFGSQRSLWCELPEVKSAGVLDTMEDDAKKLQEAYFEVISSEASYFRSLNILITHFMAAPEMLGSKGTSSVITNSERKQLFSNIFAVRDCSERLLCELETRLEENVVVDEICDILCTNFETYFEAYVKYCSNQVYQDRTLKSLRTENAQFASALHRLESDRLCQGLDMRSFLMLPMQRVTRYPLLVIAILDRVQTASRQQRNATQALHLANQVGSLCNEGARRMERTEQLLEIDGRLVYKSLDIRRIPLVSSGRYLVKRGELTQLCELGLSTKSTLLKSVQGRGRAKQLHLFLFSDLIMVTKKKPNGTYVVKDYCARAFIEIAPLEVGNPKVTSPMLNALKSRRCHLFTCTLMSNAKGKQTELLFNAESETDRERWLSAVRPPTSANPEESIYPDWDCPQVKAVHYYAASQDDELHMDPGDLINVLRKMPDGWYFGEHCKNGAKGWFPSSYAQEILNDHVRAKNYRKRLRMIQAAESLQHERKASGHNTSIGSADSPVLGGYARGRPSPIVDRLRRLSNPKTLFQNNNNIT